MDFLKGIAVGISYVCETCEELDGGSDRGGAEIETGEEKEEESEIEEAGNAGEFVGAEGEKMEGGKLKSEEIVEEIVLGEGEIEDKRDGIAKRKN